jgi:ATP/maltotriose-dependent transcriptional regulator MalT
MNAHWTRFRCLWLMGFPEQARQRAREALAHIHREKIDPRTVCAALISAGNMFQFCGDCDKVRNLTQQARQVALQHDMYLELQWIRLQEGWVRAREESREAGLAEMREVMTFLRSVGALMFMGTWGEASFAEELLAAGQTAEALQAVEHGLAFANRTGHRYCEAELHRVKGEILKSEECFRQALGIARASQSLFFELRAAAGLLRLLRESGRAAEGRELLAAVYGRFTEGFDSPDLLEAARLLA